jgi:putative DNA primase/helicase
MFVMDEIDSEAIALKETIAKKKDTQIIAKNGNNSVKSLINSMVININKTDLINTLQIKIGDPLLKYFDTEKQKIDPLKVPDNLYHVAIIHELIETAERNQWDMARQNDFIYLYNGKVWQNALKDNLLDFIQRATENMGYYSPAKAQTHKFKEDSLRQFLASAHFYEPSEDNEKVLINLQNGTLEITDKGHSLREHKASDFLTYIMPFGYEANNKSPLFDKYLKEVLPDQESRYLLQEFCGYVFTRRLKLEKALVLYGSGANGKSVFFEVFTALLGVENVATYSLGDLTDQDAGNANRAGLKDKLVNYGSEIRADKMDGDMFKRLVSGEPVTARLKYGNPFDLRSNTKFIFNANKLPQNVEHNEAFFRRFIIIPFEQTIPEEKRDPQLHFNIIDNELSGVFNWVLEGLDRLIRNGRFSECTKAKATLTAYKLESDTASLFVSEHQIQPSNNLTIDGKRLFVRYKDYCIEDGYKAVSVKTFYERLRNAGFTCERSSGNKTVVYASEK